MSAPRPSTQPLQAGLFFSALLWTLALITMSIGGVKLPLIKMITPQVLIFGGLTLVFHLYFDQRRGDLRSRMRLRPLSPILVIKVLLVGVIAWSFTLFTSDFILKVVQLAGGVMPDLYNDLLRLPFPLAMLAGAVLPACFEELAFRGYLFGHLRPLGNRTAIILSGLLFGAMHLSVVRLIPLALLGMIFASAVQRTRSLLASVLMHFLNNGIVIALTYLKKDPSAVAAAGAPTLTALAVSLVLALVLGAIILTALRWLGPLEDPAGEEEYTRSMTTVAYEAVAAGEARRMKRLSANLFFLGLLPGVLLYLVFAYGEWVIVFLG
jgi:membrane protease YdiL (CAAX protease family)